MPEEQECWLPVPGWPAYEVSTGGMVRSVPRVLAHGRRHGGQVLRQQPDRKGYLTVTLAQGRRRRTVRVHVLVMLAFAGPPPPGKPQVRHLNGDPADNRWPENLAYGDQADQEADKAALKARKGHSRRRRVGVNSNQRKTETRSKKSNSSRALALVAPLAAALPQATLSPAQTSVSSQDAPGAETGRATGPGRRS